MSWCAFFVSGVLAASGGRRLAALRAAMRLFPLLLLVVLFRASHTDAQTPLPECPSYPLYESDLVNLNAPWASICGHCILPNEPTSTPTLPVLQTATRTPSPSPTRTPTFTRTPTLTPIVSATPSQTADPDLFREFGSGYASVFVSTNGAAIGYTTPFTIDSVSPLTVS